MLKRKTEKGRKEKGGNVKRMRIKGGWEVIKWETAMYGKRWDSK
jgi:hypothetical protein